MNGKTISEDFKNQILEAKNKLSVADHLLNVTLPLIGDYKLIIIIVEDTFLAMSKAMTSLLEHDMTYKKIPFVKLNNSSDKKRMFKQYCLKKYNLNPEILSIFDNLKEIIERHRKSPVVFVKNKSLVICNDTYSKNLVVTLDFLKDAVYKTKIFIQEINTILKQ